MLIGQPFCKVFLVKSRKGIFSKLLVSFSSLNVRYFRLYSVFPLNLNLHICWELDCKQVKNSSACQEIKSFLLLFKFNCTVVRSLAFSLVSGCAILYLIAYPMANNLEAKLNASSYTLGAFISIKSYSSISQNEHMSNKTLVKVKLLIY